MQQPQDRKTLKDFGFDKCEHPDGSIAFDRGEHHCGFCGAKRVGDTFVGGSTDYKIDFVILTLRREQLEKNLT